MNKKVNCITINTDASFHPVKKVGGYAFYIICDLFKIQKSGMYKKNPKTPTESEIMCIGNAVATLLAQKELPECNILIINNDCYSAFVHINKGKTNNSKIVLKLINKAKKITGCKQEFRHVKSHNGTPDARSYVNDWCDREAKKWMRISAKRI